ncbi:MAG: helix-turn-helix domain-containing protein [Eubacterium sp.]
MIAAALERCQGDRNAVIQKLKVSRRTFYRKLAEYGLS